MSMPRHATGWLGSSFRQGLTGYAISTPQTAREVARRPLVRGAEQDDYLVADGPPTKLDALAESQWAFTAESHAELRTQWRVLGFAAGGVALLTAPGAFYYLHHHDRLSVPVSLLLTVVGVVMTRALVELGLRRFVPQQGSTVLTGVTGRRRFDAPAHLVLVATGAPAR